MGSDVELLAIQFRTTFLITETGRIQRENDPDRSPGPRLWLAGCGSGNVAGVRADVADGVTSEIAALLATEPPYVSPGRPPEHLDRYVDLLSSDDGAPLATAGLIYELPHGLRDNRGVMLVASDSDEGDRLVASLSAHGMPEPLVELGFRTVDDLWRPWCVALVDGQPVSVAFAARLSDAGAELGLVTAPAFRGRGYAAAATAGWSRLPSLRSRALFYSLVQTNTSSRRVTERLGLRLIGASLRLE